MKKSSFLILATAMFFQTSFSQLVDDGYITNSLSGRCNQDSTIKFMQAFTTKMLEVKAVNPSTINDLSNLIGFNPNNLVSLESLEEMSQTNSNCKVSTNFIRNVIELKNKVNNGYSTVGQIRDEMKRISLEPTLNDAEAASLVLMDLSLQQVVQTFSSEFANNGFVEKEGINNNAGPNINDKSNSIPDINTLKLARWIRCGLFVIGSGIIGILTGILNGIQLGVLIGGPPGAVAGGVVGGIVGGVTGLIGGAIAGCD